MDKKKFFYLQLLFIILMLTLMILLLPSKTQSYVSLLPLYQTIKSNQDFLVKDLKDQFIGINTKQKGKIKT